MTDASSSKTVLPGLTLYRTLSSTGSLCRQVAWSRDGLLIAGAMTDHSVSLWDTSTGKLHQVLRGHTGPVNCIAWSQDGTRLASGSVDQSIILWDSTTGHRLSTLEGHMDAILGLAWSTGDQLLASASKDGTIRIWGFKDDRRRWTLEGHVGETFTVAWAPTRQVLVSGGADALVCFWDLQQTRPARNIIQRARGSIFGVTWTPDGKMLASCSDDKTIRLWDAATERTMGVLEGHTKAIASISFSHDGRLLASKSTDGTVLIWRCDTWEPMSLIEEPWESGKMTGCLAFSPNRPALITVGGPDLGIRIWDIDEGILLTVARPTSTVHYLNAKAVLVGESGVGKSALGVRLAEGKFRPSEGSTHGAQFWQIPVPAHLVRKGRNTPNVRAELTLWDLAGQPEYRLVHQLFLDDTDVALLLFDCSDPADPFRGVPYWAKVLRKQARSEALRLLVSARSDVSPITVEHSEIARFLSEYGLDGYLQTSAKTGEGIDRLLSELLEGVPWETLPRTATPRLFQVVQEFMLQIKESGRSLIPMEEVCGQVRRRYSESVVTQAEIDTAVGLIQARGLVYRLDPTPSISLILLKPELVNQYASTVIQTARNHPRGIGAVPERDVVVANLPFPGFRRLASVDEKMVLESTVELLIRHDLCFREMGLLVFPSQINASRPTRDTTHPRTEVTYQFSGSIETIFASLVVRLSYTSYFDREEQWKYAAEFSRNGQRLGFTMRQVEEGTGELEIYFGTGVSEFDRVTFIRFITDHLRSKGIDIEERIRLYCPQCGNEVENKNAIQARITSGKLDIPCQYCAALVFIPQSIEERYRTKRSYLDVQQRLAQTVTRRTEQEVKAFKTDKRQYTKEQEKLIHILHLSDIHLREQTQIHQLRVQLESDLIKELQVNHLEFLAISGDIGCAASQDEYDRAFGFLDGLVKRFGLNSSRVIVAPGNHDVNWDASEDAYRFIPKRKLPTLLEEGSYVSAGDAGVLLRDEALYPQRFTAFGLHLYKHVYAGVEYPLDYSKQGILHLCTSDRIMYLALNSAWALDHHFRNRASINMDALSRALDQLHDRKYDDWLKIAVFHHPVTGREAMNDDFMQLLAVHGFQIVLHGHVHEAKEGFYKYDDKRGIHIIGAGTFGAPTREQVPGIPLQYNLLTFDPATRRLTVETRKKEKPDGAWMADARWGDKNNPSPRYTIQLKNWNHPSVGKP